MDENRNPDGNIEVSDSVLITFVDKTIGEVEGIHPSKKRKPVRIARKENSCVIEICIDVNYGIEIPDVVKELQKLVKERISKLAGLKVDGVNVEVAGLNIEELIKR